MAQSKRTSPAAASLSEQAVTGQQDILDRRLAELRSDMARDYGLGGAPIDDVIMNPNGQRVRLTEIVDHEYIAEVHSSIFAGDPAEYLEAPNPDCMYAWPAKDDPHLFARVRDGSYRFVETKELRADCKLPVATHTVPGITAKDPDTGVETPRRLVAVYDLVLVEVQPRAVKRLYKAHAFQAAMRTKMNMPFEALRKRVEKESGGYATATMTQKVET